MGMLGHEAFMTRIFALFLCTIGPTAAVAETCRDDILALFQGPLDPFQRPPHRQDVRVLDADGTEIRVMLNTVETPMRTIAGQPSAQFFTLAIDQDVWTGPSPEGPWTASPSTLPADRADAMRGAQAQQIANLSDTQCLGPDGAGNLRCSYRTQTDPDATGSYFGSLDTITVDRTSGHVIRFEQTEFVNSWTDGVSHERWVIDVTFDPTITIARPE